MGNGLNRKDICHNIKEHILEKNHMNVKTVGNASAVNIFYSVIKEHILERNHLNAKSVENISERKEV